MVHAMAKPVTEMFSNYLDSTVLLSGVENLPSLSSGSKQTIFVCLDSQLTQFFTTLSTNLDPILDSITVISYSVSKEPSFNLSIESLEQHSAFIALELQPYLEENLKEKPDLVLVGQQFNAILAVYTASYYSYNISAVLSLSGSFYWKPQTSQTWEWLTEWFVEKGNCPTHVYLLLSLNLRLEPPRDIPTARIANHHLHNILRAKGCNSAIKEFSARQPSREFLAELQTACDWILEQLKNK